MSRSDEPSEPQDEALCARFRDLALRAGHEIMAVFRSPIRVEKKSDETPVTEADRRAEAVILAGLRAALPGIPCIAEEEYAGGHVEDLSGGTFMLVDPLDGTREFIGRRTDFTVNIALVRAGAPVAGVVFAPARGVIYWAGPGGARMCDVAEDGLSAERRIGVRPRPERPVVVASRSHRSPETDAFIAGLGEAETVAIGSSLKFCLLAEGKADIYPRFGRTMQWDTAAGDAVLRAAGGSTLTAGGDPLRYGGGEGTRGRFANPDFIACGADCRPLLAGAPHGRI